ncbi:HNH endonuclease [Halosolutus gelatinilyticus]|uniref:HNH endonuclease n=1 Tax=Halosolutus gelatinilyticus TaxID=2931975 RepID=UPI001FF5E767|nr:HNH endonuclease [Halosolutus gelatinilyticus]
MTSREWRADRRAVFDRDEYTCQHCGAVGGDGESTAVRTYPVGDVPLEGTVHESSLATVCDRCFTVLRESESLSGLSADRNGLFRIVRDITRAQGATISDVASFASLATSLPTALADGEETDLDYVETRRDVLLAIDLVDVRLDRLAAVDASEHDPAVASLLETVSETATDLQFDLRRAVELGETVVTEVGRCRGCFEPIASDRACSTCGLEPRPLAAWRRSTDDGAAFGDESADAVAFDRLFASINDALRGTSETTAELTDRTTEFAETLLEG